MTGEEGFWFGLLVEDDVDVDVGVDVDLEAGVEVELAVDSC